MNDAQKTGTADIPDLATPTNLSGVLSAAAAPNRRANPRYLARWRAVLISTGEPKRRFDGRTENVSISGVAIAITSNIPRGEEYQVYLELTDQNGRPTEVFEARGKVMHCNLSQQEFKVGIAFSQFHDGSDKLLRNALTCGQLKQLSEP